VVEISVKNLFQAARDVRRDGLGVVERRLGGDVDPADVLRFEPASVHQALGRVGAHGDDVLVDVGHRRGVQAQSFGVLLGVVPLRRGEGVGKV
jgi:hypothetical protein